MYWVELILAVYWTYLLTRDLIERSKGLNKFTNLFHLSKNTFRFLGALFYPLKERLVIDVKDLKIYIFN